MHPVESTHIFRTKFKAERDVGDYQFAQANDYSEHDQAIESHPAFQYVTQRQQNLARSEFLDIEVGRAASQVQNVRSFFDFERQAARTKR